MTPTEKLQLALSKLREIRTTTAGLGNVEFIIKDVISDLEKPKCEHPPNLIRDTTFYRHCTMCGEKFNY